jgi:hypothetical protein
MDAGRFIAVVSLTVVVIFAVWFLMRRRTTEGFAGSSGLTEGFAAMTDAEKNQWKERMQSMVKYMIMWGFVGMNDTKTAVYSMFDPTRGQAIFSDLLSGPLTGDAAKYYTEKLWVSTVDWEGTILYGETPLMYRDIDQYVRNHPMFSSDQWEQTLSKSMDSLSYINYYYNQAVAMERNLAQIVPNNSIVGGQWRKRVRYLLCALQNSTTYETFQTALTSLGVKPEYFIYTANPFLYNRLKKIYDTYTGATALTHLENQSFIYFQWEVILGNIKADVFGTMTATLDRLPDNCSGAAISIPNVSLATGASSSAGGSSAGGSSAGSAAGTGRTQLTYATPPEVAAWAITSPPMTIPAKPAVAMPVITPAPPADAVPFTPLDSTEEQKRFKWVLWILAGLAILLWIVFLILFMFSQTDATDPQTSVQAPVFSQ